METAAEVRKQIKFNFQPFIPENKKSNAVEKADNQGKKHKYIEGIASGPKTDAHEERMTPECIKDFMEQANSGNILLYADLHGIRSTTDIGILDVAKILDNGDWFISCKLYDDSDGVDKASIDTANKLWLQINGLPPYKKPIQKGFSIEGFIGPQGILSAEKDQLGQMRKRVINKVDLDGVVVVPRPAYKDSIVHGVYKALGEISPWKSEKVQKQFQSFLQSQLSKKETEHNYNQRRWDVESAMQDQIESIMSKDDYDKQDQLTILFDEYKEIMIPLIMQSESAFIDEEADEDQEIDNPYEAKDTDTVSKAEVLRKIYKNIEAAQKVLQKFGG